MKLSTLKAAERAAWRLMKIFEKESKTDAEAKRLYDEADKFWQARFNEWKKTNDAQAERADKGVILWTILVPESYATIEYVCTPRRLITTHLWKNLGATTLRRGDSRTEVCNKYCSPAYHRRNYLSRPGATITEHVPTEVAK